MIENIKKNLSGIFTRFDTIAFILTIIFFLIWPKIDINISQLFYDSNNGGFFWKDHFLANFSYQLVRVITVISIIGLMLLIIASSITKYPVLKKQRMVFFFFFSVIIVGPGLVVNTMLKETWERPRPRQVVEFGGYMPFEEPLNPQSKSSQDPSKYKSFVSGHASVGFMFFGLTILLKRKVWVILPILFGLAIGLGRIVQGGHFFSDVIFSGWSVWFSVVILYNIFIKYKLLPKKDINI